MTTFRLIPLSVHGALEMLTGLVLMLAPFMVSLSPAGGVAAVTLGAILVGVALTSMDVGDRSVGVGAHYALDHGVALGLLAGAISLLALAGDAAAALVLALAALLQLTLSVTTRYSLGR